MLIVINSYVIYVLEYGSDVDGKPSYNIPTRCSDNQQSLIDIAEGYCQQKLEWKIDEYHHGLVYEIKFNDRWIRISPCYTDKRP